MSIVRKALFWNLPKNISECYFALLKNVFFCLLIHSHVCKWQIWVRFLLWSTVARETEACTHFGVVFGMNKTEIIQSLIPTLGMHLLKIVRLVARIIIKSWNFQSFSALKKLLAVALSAQTEILSAARARA